MKRLVFLVVLFSSACGGSLSDARPLSAHEKQMFVSRPPPTQVPALAGLSTIGARVQIDVPPPKVWTVFAIGFGNVSHWAGAGVAASECTSGGKGQLGATRSCRIADRIPMFGGDDYFEEVVGWDAKQGYFTVLQTQATGPTSLLLNENWVDSDGKGGTVVTQLVHVEFDFPATIMNLEGVLKEAQVRSLIGLKHLCETGEHMTVENFEALEAKYPQVKADNGL